MPIENLRTVPSDHAMSTQNLLEGALDMPDPVRHARKIGVAGDSHDFCALQAMQDLLAGQVDYQCPSLPTAMPQIAGQTVKALAILSKRRSSSRPELPSAHEQGLTDFDIPSWYALFLPRATPDAIVRKLHDATSTAMDMQLMQERLKQVGSDLVEPGRRSPQYLARFVASEIRKWEGPIKSQWRSVLTQPREARCA
jgi:hypothetical protein